MYTSLNLLAKRGILLSMSRRIVSLLLCLVMLMALPLGAAASESQNSTISAGEVRYVPSGSVTFGSISLYDPDGNELPLEYAYSSSITLSASIAGQLSKMLSDYGFSLPAMNYDYQLMNRQSFFVVRVTDGQALSAVIDGIMNRSIAAETYSPVSASDVSASDLSPSDADAAVSPEDNSSFVTPEPDDHTPPSDTTSLHKLLFGSASFEVFPTLESSVRNAFPEFDFAAPEAAVLPDDLTYISGVTMPEDRLSAQIAVTPEPEYVEREMFGEVFKVLMVSNVAYRYDFARFDIVGTTDGAVVPEKPEEPSDTDLPAEPEEEEIIPDEPEETTTTTTTTTTVTTSTTTTISTTEKVTTTTTTSVPDDDDDHDDDYPRTGVVTTRWKRLNVRTGPGTGYDSIAQIDKGDTVSVVDYKDGWYKVELFDGTVGWCTAEYITLKD